MRNTVMVDEIRKAKSPLTAILTVSLIECLVLSSVIWAPILVTIYDEVLYWILILYAPLLITIPVGAYTIYAKKMEKLTATNTSKSALRSGTGVYMVAEIVELMASVAGTIVRIYYYSNCSTSSNTTCRTLANNAAALSLLILNIIAMGASVVALMMLYLYTKAVSNMKNLTEGRIYSPLSNRVVSKEGSAVFIRYPGVK